MNSSPPTGGPGSSAAARLDGQAQVLVGRRRVPDLELQVNSSPPTGGPGSSAAARLDGQAQVLVGRRRVVLGVTP